MTRSELQCEDDPKCTADANGRHCACLDVHDACCDCPAHISDDGELCMAQHDPSGD